MDARSRLSSNGSQRIRNVDFQAADLNKLDLSRLSADGLNLEEANLCNAKLCEARLEGCRMESTRLENSEFSRTTMRMCSLNGAYGKYATFTNARLEDSTAEAADFSHASFRCAHLTETSFSRAVLRETIFDEAEGTGIGFRGADLRSASLKGVRFDEADFRGADLRGADLSGGRFHAADFRGALLEGTCFDNADYAGATFDHGEHPIRSAPAAEAPPEATDQDAIKILNEFLALLPDATSGSRPDTLMNRLQELIDKTSASAGFSPAQQRAVHDLLTDFTKPGGLDTARLQQLVATLKSDSSEPPEELKAWLEPFMKAMQKDRKP
jgi:uncharacterized protein YjbI with pentapeptide repeats